MQASLETSSIHKLHSRASESVATSGTKLLASNSLNAGISQMSLASFWGKLRFGRFIVSSAQQLILSAISYRTQLYFSHLSRYRSRRPTDAESEKYSMEPTVLRPAAGRAGLHRLLQRGTIRKFSFSVWTGNELTHLNFSH